MLEAQNLAAGFGRKPLFDGVSLTVPKGHILGLEGPSGAGKTTLGRTLAGLHPALKGRVMLHGSPLPGHGAGPVQYLHQNPLLAMNPRWRIGRVLSESAPVSEAQAQAFGVTPDWLQRYPHEMSGGQLQRVSILRALAARPAVLIADEITASLDQISQAQIWRLLQKICQRDGLGILAISHDADLLSRIATAGRMTLSPA